MIFEELIVGVGKRVITSKYARIWRLPDLMFFPHFAHPWYRGISNPNQHWEARVALGVVF